MWLFILKQIASFAIMQILHRLVAKRNLI